MNVPSQKMAANWAPVPGANTLSLHDIKTLFICNTSTKTFLSIKMLTQGNYR